MTRPVRFRKYGGGSADLPARIAASAAFKRLRVTPCRVICCLALACLCPVFYTAQARADDSRAAQELGWVVAKVHPGMCGGYYQRLPIVYTANPATSDQADNYDFDADMLSWSRDGATILTGHVKIVQEDRQMNADRAVLTRDAKTKQLVRAQGTGHVRYRRSSGLLAIADDIDWQKGLISLRNVLYRAPLQAPHPANADATQPANESARPANTSRQIGADMAFGRAEEVREVAPHVYKMRRVTYSACSPLCRTWQVRAAKMELNYPRGTGVARHAWFLLHGVPVFYLPYYSFPLNRWRKTGFLTPMYGYRSESGFSFAWPFYWNMAPNYDFTFTPDLLSRRGIQLNGRLRYLTPTSQGFFYASLLPHDRLFKQLQADSAATYAGNPNTADRLRALENASDNRAKLIWRDQSQFDAHWHADADINYVSDDYYQQDLVPAASNGTVNDQLLQKLDLDYLSTSWSVATMLQRYQTLHPINQSAISNQYARVPQVTLKLFPAARGNWQFNMQDIFTYFDIAPNPDSSTRLVTGSRFFAEPTVSYRDDQAGGGILSQLKLWTVGYAAQDRPQNYGPLDSARAIPVFDTLAHLNFVRNVRFLGHDMEQTLEPQIYYLFVPFVNQQQLPIFDSASQVFTYAQAFADNRFSGYDRLGDANQTTFAVSSRLLNDAAETKAKFDVAEIYYFRKRHVCAGYNCSPMPPIDRQALSPLAGDFSYYVNPDWSVSSQWSFNPEADWQVGSQYDHFQYNNGRQLLNLGFYYVTGSQVSGVAPTLQTTSDIQDLRQGLISFAWRLNPHIRALGAFNYNIGRLSATGGIVTRTYNTFTYGIQYDSCCWGMRVAGYRALQGFSNGDDRPLFDSGVYVQFYLRGLANFGASDMTRLLQNNIQGYQPGLY